jgi:hypothetical protein
MQQINTIDDVIFALDEIIATAEQNQNPLGYFAALYRKVTIKVKEGISENFFDDGPRMEKLDIVFAQRYLVASFDWLNNKEITGSWKKTFEISGDYWPVVLQHLLLGMNAHINLDLGIAAAAVTRGGNIHELENDFYKINQILSTLVVDVQKDLASIWPALTKILRRTGKTDDFLVDFSMELARDGAWKFAQKLAGIPDSEISEAIKERDAKVVKKANLMLKPGMVASLILKIIRLGEKGSVKEKIRHLAG